MLKHCLCRLFSLVLILPGPLIAQAEPAVVPKAVFSDADRQQLSLGKRDQVRIVRLFGHGNNVLDLHVDILLARLGQGPGDVGIRNIIRRAAKTVERLGIPFEEGTTLFVSNWRKLDPLSVPLEAKVAANYLNGMVARQEAQKNGFENAVMLDTHGFIAEGGTESVFLVKDNRLMTPATGTVLKSITRMSILEAAKTDGIECVEGQLKPELLFEAEEIFLSCTPFKVLPVRQINDRKLDNAPGPLTRKIAELLDTIAGGNDDRFKDWMYPV